MIKLKIPKKDAELVTGNDLANEEMICIPTIQYSDLPPQTAVKIRRRYIGIKLCVIRVHICNKFVTY
jgi:hypothetical protein